MRWRHGRAALRPSLMILAMGMAGLLTLALTGSARTVSRIAVGNRPADIAFRDLAGGSHTLHATDNRPAVYLFLSTQCPAAKAYSPRIVALEKAYRAKGVRVFGVFSNVNEGAQEIAAHAKERNYVFPIVRDNGALAKRLGALMTPEAVLLDAKGVIRYRGRIDDNADAARVRSRDLQNALDSVLAGKLVARPETKVVGCTIRPAMPAASAKNAKFTFARDVAPIIQKNCLPCHRSGAVAPFSLETYQQAAAWASLIKDTTQARRMPPWKAESNGEFHNEMRLTESEIATLAAWADSGAPMGSPKELPPNPKFSSGWMLGEPDAVLEPSEPYHLAAEGRDVYQCFVFPTNFEADRFISALEAKPGNNAVVHHVIAWLDTTGTARRLDAQEPGPGYRSNGGFPGFVPAGFLGGWAPGNLPFTAPQGTGVHIPKGADIVLEVHYHSNGKPQTDKTKIGLHFTKGPVQRTVRAAFLANPMFVIPAGAKDYPVFASMNVPQDITVLGVMPHMHLLGKQITVTAIKPDGQKRRMVHVPRWDFNWQTTYSYKEPLLLEKGSRVRVDARYDNSEDNPNNPSRPPKPVGWGEQTTDEMCLAIVMYTINGEDLTQGVKAPRLNYFEIGRGQ